MSVGVMKDFEILIADAFDIIKPTTPFKFAKYEQEVSRVHS